jgi:hypothetical protein
MQVEEDLELRQADAIDAPGSGGRFSSVSPGSA